MSVTRDAAIAQWEALRQAVDRSPVRQVRYELRRRAAEWQRALSEWEPDDAEAAIELAGAVGPGMRVPTLGGWGVVIRQIQRDGQMSLHVEGDDGRPVYLNFAGPHSPVVVRA